MGNQKGKAPPRYEAAFKEGAVKLVTESGRQTKDVATELGVGHDTLKNWLKAYGVTAGVANRDNRAAQRIKELEAQNRELRREVAEKQEVIDVLKKSVGILSKP
jgi:transposase